uniref:Putative secreted protein n=1 Tax=Anopheles marajoara TaxID=58244 RepID=A0A2M4CD33_9DIPT
MFLLLQRWLPLLTRSLATTITTHSTRSVAATRFNAFHLAFMWNRLREPRDAAAAAAHSINAVYGWTEAAEDVDALR